MRSVTSVQRAALYSLILSTTSSSIRPDLVPQQLGIQNLDVLTEPIHLKPKSKRGHYERRLMQHYARYIKEWEEQRYNTCIKDTSEDFVLPDIPPHQQVVPPPPPPEVVPFEEPHGDSPDTMQPQEQVPGGYSPVQPQEPSGYSPETSLGTSLHRNSSDSSQPPPYASPSHQVNASCF
ncbi:hypothetical protein LguiB_001181 [Lonicera macranthoides]